jgi:hypothetical protein
MVPALMAAMVDGFNDELDMMAVQVAGVKSAIRRASNRYIPWKWPKEMAVMWCGV